jgi:hypothetical protein
MKRKRESQSRGKVGSCETRQLQSDDKSLVTSHEKDEVVCFVEMFKNFHNSTELNQRF